MMNESNIRKRKYQLMEQQQFHRTKRTYHEKQRDWAEIPFDVLSIIFEKLGAVDVLVSAQGVCRSWRKLAFDPTIKVWRCIDMRNDPQKSLLHLMSAIERSENRLEKLYAVNVHGDIFNCIAGRIPNLKFLGIFGRQFDEKKVLNLIAQCPSLEELHICSPAFYAQLFVEIIQIRPELKRLCVDGRLSLDTDNESRSKGDSNLSEDDSSSTEEDWSSSEDDSSSTEEEFSEEDWSSSEEDMSSGNSMIQLRELRLDISWVHKKRLHAMLDKCIHLEYLDLRSRLDLRIDADLQAKLDKIKTVRVSRST